MTFEPIPLNQCATPDDVIATLRQVARDYHESHAELQAAWQDETAGVIWSVIGDELFKVADIAEKRWKQITLAGVNAALSQPKDA